MSKRVRKAIIPAAGLGTRFLPATKAQAKAVSYTHLDITKFQLMKFMVTYH